MARLSFTHLLIFYKYNQINYIKIRKSITSKFNKTNLRKEKKGKENVQDLDLLVNTLKNPAKLLSWKP